MRLVIWEAQFGDFANGGQVVIDQFIASGEVKWGRICGLVLLLPHGYEGQGPEHSSARPERYLQLCAEHNMQVCVPTTPAQIYHLFRRQMLRSFRRPLIVMSPKSLLRHKEAVSSLEELANGGFQNVIGEIEKVAAKNVRRVILCSGKVYYELVAHRREQKINDVAIIRLEQQYPFPHADFKAQLAKFPERDGDRLVPGRAAEPGRVVSAARLFPRRRVAEPDRRLRRAAGGGDDGGRLHVEAPRAAEEADRRRVRAAAALRGRDARPHLTGSTAMRVEVKVPQLPESVAEATLVNWHKKPGEAVTRDENLVDVETDKVVLELPAPAAGSLIEIRKGDGSTVAGQEVIAVIDTEAKGAAARRAGGHCSGDGRGGATGVGRTARDCAARRPRGQPHCRRRAR